MVQHLLKKIAMAALLAFAGSGIVAYSPARAAVLVPSKDAAASGGDALVTHVRRGGGSYSGGGRASGGSRSFSSSGSRSFGSGGGRSSGTSGRSFRGSSGSAVRSGRSSSFRGAPAARSSNQFRGTRHFRGARSRQTFRANPALRRDSAIRSGRSVHRRGYRPPGAQRWHPRHHAHRRWHRRPYYGYIVGGVTIGAILAASAYYAYADEPPADGLCWYWTDAYETRGYWDYCDDPY